MALLILGVLLWALSHSLKRWTPGLRMRLGEGPGKGLATVLALAGLVAMVKGYRAADVVVLWSPPLFLHHVNNLLMVIAVVLVNLPYNRGRMRSWLRHPMLASVHAWALAHLLVNGDLASVILFGGLLAWSVSDMILINRMEPAWTRPAPGPAVNDAIYLALSAVLFAAIVFVHNWLGYWPLG